MLGSIYVEGTGTLEIHTNFTEARLYCETLGVDCCDTALHSWASNEKHFTECQNASNKRPDKYPVAKYSRGGRR